MMDEMTKKRYKYWMWKKILKRIIIPVSGLLALAISLILFLSEQEEEDAISVVFESVTIPGFEIEVETLLSLKSNAFDLQGNLLADEQLVDENVIQLLEALKIDIPEIIETAFIFSIELISYEFTHETNLENTSITLPLPSNSLAKISTDEMIDFSAITFDHSGIFTYQISQLTEVDSDEWNLSAINMYVIVNIEENLETETLEATVVKESDLVFVNTFEYDISETIRTVTREQWETRVAQAYEAGYEYVKNDAGEYERVAIYAPQSAETAESPIDHPPAAPNPPPATSGFPEDNAITISSSDALSYLALVNRHFRVSSQFSPGDLSVVNVQSILGVHSMRSTAARAIENLFEAAAEEGHILVATSGYRSYATQQATHNHFISTRGETEARRVSARPGHSEHQLGLAIDITTPTLGNLSSTFSSTPEGTWVRENAHHFGFIIRYPAGREADTGFIYEPWHLRYVGTDTATQMFGSGLILEEFLGIN